jgi:hypothetical protein
MSGAGRVISHLLPIWWRGDVKEGRGVGKELDSARPAGQGRPAVQPVQGILSP